MKTLLALILGSAVLTGLTAKSVDVYFGTGTSSDAIGIFHAKFDPNTGKLGERTLAAKIKEPEFLALHPNGSHLYAVAKKDVPVLAAYRIAADGTLALLNTVPMRNGQGAHLAVHPSGKFLITAQYFEGSVGVFPLADNGSVEEQTQVLPHANPSKVHRRQMKPHPHWTGFSPDGAFALVPDLGTDNIHLYRVDLDGRALTPHGLTRSGPGSGPRHMRFSADGKFVHLLNELTVAVSTFAYDADAGSAILLHTTPALSDRARAKYPETTGSEILVHPHGRFLYSANRGHDSVTVFEADPATGALTRVQTESIRGSWPRHTRIDPTGKWLFVSGEASNTVSIFAINPENGTLTFRRGDVINLPSVYCILFKD
ncbi:MAG: lactonase family protein [Synoicihabitans sp.]